MGFGANPGNPFPGTPFPNNAPPNFQMGSAAPVSKSCPSFRLIYNQYMFISKCCLYKCIKIYAAIMSRIGYLLCKCFCCIYISMLSVLVFVLGLTHVLYHNQTALKKNTTLKLSCEEPLDLFILMCLCLKV